MAATLVACAPSTPWTPECDPAREDDYVPIDLDDSLTHLRCILDDDVVAEMYAGSEDDMVRYHHGLGTGLRNSWGLWGGSRLRDYFHSVGLEHPDDMSGVILDSFWRRLHGKPIRLKSQVRYYQRYWEAHAEPPSLSCPNGDVVTSTASIGEGEGSILFPYRVTNYAHCPGSGWYATDGPSDDWQPLRGEVPEFLLD